MVLFLTSTTLSESERAGARAGVTWAHSEMTTAEGFPEAIRAPPHAVEIAISDRRAHRHGSGLRSARRPRAPPDAGQQRDLQCKPHGNERRMKLRKLLGEIGRAHV